MKKILLVCLVVFFVLVVVIMTLEASAVGLQP